MLGRLLASFAIVTIVLSGCLTTDPAVNPDGDLIPAWINPVILGHEHDDLAAHKLAQHMSLVGRELIGEKGPPGYPGEIDVVHDRAFVALLGYGFAILDISDPTNPEVISTTESPSPALPVKPPVVNVFGRYAADIKTDTEGEWAFLALHASPTPGLLIYDTRDQANPKLAGAWVEPNMECHMVEYGVIAGEEYLFCAPLDNAIRVGKLLPPTPAGAREVVTVARIQLHNAESVQAIADDPSVESAERTLSGHDDMTLQPDPLTGDPILVISAWDLGVRIVDISNPVLPVELGAWLGDDAEFFRGNIHTAMAFKSSDDRRIVVAIPEVANPPTMFVLDATDLGNIKTLAEWRAVEDFGEEAGKFSMHNFQIVDSKVYLAMYHAGLVILDLSTPELLEAPKPIASFMPSEPRHDGENYQVGAWDVVVWHGYTLTADSHGGFYVLHHEGDPAGDPAYTSFA